MSVSHHSTHPPPFTHPVPDRAFYKATVRCSCRKRDEITITARSMYGARCHLGDRMKDWNLLVDHGKGRHKAVYLDLVGPFADKRCEKLGKDHDAVRLDAPVDPSEEDPNGLRPAERFNDPVRLTLLVSIPALLGGRTLDELRPILANAWEAMRVEDLNLTLAYKQTLALIPEKDCSPLTESATVLGDLDDCDDMFTCSTIMYRWVTALRAAAKDPKIAGDEEYDQRVLDEEADEDADNELQD